MLKRKCKIETMKSSFVPGSFDVKLHTLRLVAPKNFNVYFLRIVIFLKKKKTKHSTVINSNSIIM